MIREAIKDELYTLTERLKYRININDFEKCFIYELNNQLIGFIDFSVIYDRIELNYIWIDDNHRGKNYSSDLMNYMIDFAKKRSNIENITLEVSIKNSIAIHLYEKFGFSKVAIRSGYYNGIDGILMIRKFDIDEKNLYIGN